jgi:hypothetical protein
VCTPHFLDEIEVELGTAEASFSSCACADVNTVADKAPNDNAAKE